MITEAIATAVFCALAGGTEEVRHTYHAPSKSSYVKVDCETDKDVVEAGLDKRSSLDSVQQAAFFATVTGKNPVIVIYDTDGVTGIYEHRIKEAAMFLKMDYLLVNVQDIKNPQITDYYSDPDK